MSTAHKDEGFFEKLKDGELIALTVGLAIGVWLFYLYLKGLGVWG